MKKSLIFRILVVFATSLMFLRCSCDDEPTPTPGPSSNPVTLLMSNPSPWTGGVYKITVTGIDPCNTGYVETYQTTNWSIDVWPPKHGQFSIAVTLELTNTWPGNANNNDGCPGTCQSGQSDGRPIFQGKVKYTHTGINTIDCKTDLGYWDQVNLHLGARVDCGC